MAKESQEKVDEILLPAEVDLFGSFRFKVDAKGRLALPSKFRKVLPHDLVVSRGPHGECLYVFTADTFNEWIEQLFDRAFGGYDATNDEHIELRSTMKANADGVEVDSAGRIALRSDLRDVAGIEKNVVIVGNSGYFEIWDEGKFDEKTAKVDVDVFFS